MDFRAKQQSLRITNSDRRAIGPELTLSLQRLLLVFALFITPVAAVIAVYEESSSDAPNMPLAVSSDELPSHTANETETDLAGLQGFAEYELYSLGDSFGKLPLNKVRRVLGDGMNFVDFIYGDCDASQGGCPFPLDVQVWPACLRNRSSYELSPGQPYPYQPLMLRGVPAGLYDDGTRLELYTGEVTVVIFGEDSKLVLSASEQLRPLDASNASSLLPQPVSGALDGSLTCGDSTPTN